MEYDHGKPCRACTDFKSWMKTGQKTSKPGQKTIEANSEITKKNQSTCPPDVNKIGRSSWTLLHTMSVYLPEKELPQKTQNDLTNFVSILSRTYPCSHCAEDMRKDISQEPPKVQTGQEFANWLCKLHNKVNVKLGKAEFDCRTIYERWRDGPNDGSCD
jgi:FAD-linked sulfhydryl oxidase